MPSDSHSFKELHGNLDLTLTVRTRIRAARTNLAGWRYAAQVALRVLAPDVLERFSADYVQVPGLSIHGGRRADRW